MKPVLNFSAASSRVTVSKDDCTGVVNVDDADAFDQVVATPCSSSNSDAAVGGIDPPCARGTRMPYSLESAVVVISLLTVVHR